MNILIADDELYMLKILRAYFEKENYKVFLFLGNIKVDLKGKKIFKDEVDLSLTKKEFQLFQCLYENRDMILTRKQLLDITWGLDYFGEERTVDTHIRRLREKIGEELIKYDGDQKTNYTPKLS